jgi:mannose-6-phosphate isomerase-like protein (cupin superfamily)
MIEEIKHNDTLLAIIIRRDFARDGIHFFTPDEFSQQLAYMSHPAGKVIPAHVHNPVERTVHFTKEVLFIRKGRLRVDFYTEAQEYLESRILEGGDVILLSEGGHGFQALDDLQMFEVKQGPYTGEGDKTRFEGIMNNEPTTDQPLVGDTTRHRVGDTTSIGSGMRPGAGRKLKVDIG